MRKHGPAVLARAATCVPGTPARPRPSVAGSSWLLLAVVLAGLFAMHGLSTHGTHVAHAAESAAGSTAVPASGSGAMSGSMSGSMSGAVSRPSTDASVHADLTNPVRTASHLLVPGDVPGAPSWPGGLLGLCLAVLSSLLAWLLTCGRASRVLALVPAVSQVVTARGRGRDRDPPSLLVLSIRRC